ncbi:MAG: xanthine dehydrogenase family protein molybdopterin-binding subunit [Actinomycetota bacterium]
MSGTGDGPNDVSAAAGVAPTWVGRPMLRREDAPILRGAARYIDDLTQPDMLHMVVVRSPFAHALIGGIDASAALACPGVAAVVTGVDLAGVVRPMPINPADGADVAPVPITLLATDRVRFTGEPVAAVVAETRAIAEDAAELVVVDYDPLPVVVDPHEALRGSVTLHEDVADNVLVRWRRTSGDVDGAFAASARTIRGRFHIPRIVAAPIETRGALADYDPDDDMLTLWISSQDPHRPMSHLSAVLGRDRARIRIIVPEVGGAFGSKGTLAPEAGVAAIASMRMGRPVKWIEDRSENFLASYQGRGQDADVELAVDAEGRFLAVRARLVADLGAYLYPTTPVVPVTTAMLVAGVYATPAADVELLGVATNTVPTGPCRGAGRPEATFIAERMADLAATELGMDPVEIRRRNFIPPERFPYTSPLGFTYDSGRYERALDRVCELIDYPGLRREQPTVRAAGRVTGIGLSVFIERAGAGVWESGAVSIGPSGHVVVRTGSTPHGQGHATTFAQIAADELGVDPGDVEIRAGDTAEVPEGVGSFASRSVTVGGSAIVEAAREVREQARRVAAHLLGAPPGEVRWEGGWFEAPGRRPVSIREVAEAAHDPDRIPDGMEPGLEASVRFELSGPVFPFGAYALTVEIDPQTGDVAVGGIVAVDDAGRIVNPMLAEGQVVGSTVQGLGESLFEEVVYDEAGQLLTGTFTQYGIPGATEVPAIESEFQETPSPFTALGAKGIGESGSIAVPAAVANAVADALSPFGVTHLDLPFTPERVWRAIRDAGSPEERA